MIDQKLKKTDFKIERSNVWDRLKCVLGKFQYNRSYSWGVKGRSKFATNPIFDFVFGVGK